VEVTPRSPGRLELKIDRLSPADAGQYLCTSVNDIGQHNDTANITVLCESPTAVASCFSLPPPFWHFVVVT